jgi:hypothetical protein
MHGCVLWFHVNTKPSEIRTLAPFIFYSFLIKHYFCTLYWKIGTWPKPYFLLAKNIETWWMPCYPLKITSEPIITTLGSKPCTFQNSNKFWPNSPNLILFFSFFLFSSPTRPRRHSSRPFSLPLPYPLALSVGHKEGGSPRQILPRLHSPRSHSPPPP